MLCVIRVGEIEMFLLWEDGDYNSLVEWMIIYVDSQHVAL